jgi:hypothetical protein
MYVPHPSLICTILLLFRLLSLFRPLSVPLFLTLLVNNVKADFLILFGY